MGRQMNLERSPLVSTAILYPNGRMHVGFAWECIGSDWLCRGLRALGHPTFFSTGLDEHSVNVEKAAREAGLEPQVYCNTMAEATRNVMAKLDVKYDRFIRTTDSDHRRVVQKLLQRSMDAGDIYSSHYEGWYCDGCEAYYTPKDLVDGHCPQHSQKPRWISEENYFFRLSRYQEAIVEHFARHPDFLRPESRRHEVLNFVQSGLRDFSISRAGSSWGIPLPFDPTHGAYVWFDALINYLTASGLEAYLDDSTSTEAAEFNRRWPAHMHVIGKDISRFHCVYWPAMLLSLGLALPRHVFAHGHLLLDGKRMSKSSGHTVDPEKLVDLCGVDAFRYYLLAENQFGQDGNFSYQALIRKNNADLANDWGNLVNRVLSMTRKYYPGETISAVPGGEVPEMSLRCAAVIDLIQRLPADLGHCLEQVDTMGYAAVCMAASRALNLLIDQTKPWSLAQDRSVEGPLALRYLIHTLLESIRWVATALEPLIPQGSGEVLRQLGTPELSLLGSISSLRWGSATYTPNPPQPIFARLEEPWEEAQD